MNWISFKKEVPPRQDEYLVAVRNKNKEDGIWLYEVLYWNGRWFERNENWEDILYWCKVNGPEE